MAEPRMVTRGGTVDAAVRCCIVTVQGGGAEVVFEHRAVRAVLLDCRDCVVRFERGVVATLECVRCSRVRVVVLQPGGSVTVDESSMLVLQLPPAPPPVFSTAARMCVVSSSAAGDDSYSIPSVPGTGVRLATELDERLGWRSHRVTGLGLAAADVPSRPEDDDDPDLARLRQGSDQSGDEDAACRRKLRIRTTANLTLRPQTPCEILPDLLLSDARGVASAYRLRSMGVTHVLNLAADETPNLDEAYGAQGITLVKIGADDSDSYDIMQHAEEASEAHQAAKAASGKLVVHCVAGVNRSGALATALYMLQTRANLLDAARKVNLARGPYLTNVAFNRQLTAWARRNSLIETAPEAAARVHSS